MNQWKPVKRVPMLSNGPRVQIGQAQVVAVPLMAALAKWVLPWLAVSGGVALTSYVTSKSLPQIPINKGNIALASALAGGGATAYFVAQGLPENYRPWAYAASVAGIGSALYFLFQEEPPAPGETPIGGDIQPEMADKSCVVPKLALEPAGRPQTGLGITFDPAQSKTGGTWRSKYTEQQYSFLLQNFNETPRCFYVGLNIKDEDGRPGYSADNAEFANGKSPAQNALYGRQYVALAGKGRTATVTGPDGKSTKVTDSMPMLLKAPAYTEALSWNAIPGATFNTSVGVELFRNYRDGIPFQVSESISILQTTVG